MQQSYKAYISATQKDLLEYRAQVHDALRRLSIEDVAMESYVADGRPPLEKCLADVRRCDVYIGLFAWRYGFRPDGSDQSITELEYREARAHNKPCYIFLLAEDAAWPVKHVDQGEDRERIEALRTDLARSHVCSYFNSPQQLDSQVTAALANFRSGQRTAEPGPGGGALSDTDRDTYLRQLRRQYEGLDLDALSLGPPVEQPGAGLTSVFVEPSVREDAAPELPRAWRRRLQAEDGPGGEFEPPDRQQAVLLRESFESKVRHRLFDVVQDPARRLIVVLGDPGSGKTALTRFVALALAGADPEGRLAGLHGYLPVPIELRSYLAYTRDGGTGFLDYLDQRAAAGSLGLPREALLAHLQAGRPVLFLLDGLDEILDPQWRGDVAERIATFATRYPRVRVLVTSRLAGYPRGALARGGFEHFTLDDLDDGQIDAFLRAWHGPVSGPVGDPAAPTAEQRRAQLREAIAGSAALRELAGNPLLLTILSVTARTQELPRERWTLYDHAANVLIRHWDVGRRLREHHTGAEVLDEYNTKALLQRVALFMQSGPVGLGGNYIARAELLTLVEDFLVEQYEHPRGQASAMAGTIIDQLRERTFILSRYGPSAYGFEHRAFLEFFCAQAIVERFERGDEPYRYPKLQQLFRDRWADPSWREVLRLIVGRLPASQAGNLIQMLAVELNRPWPAGAFRQPPWNLVLAAQCVAEVPHPRLIASAARAVLREVILLIEHGVTVEDRAAVDLVEAEILPPVRVLGERWPGREEFAHWYRRRGIRVSWSGSAFATRLAALLASPHEGLEGLLDAELGTITDRRARHALVAGLAEVAAIPAAADRPAEANRRAHCGALLAARAENDQHGAVRLAALEALVAGFGDEPRTLARLAAAVAEDPFPELRLMAVRTLGDRPEREAVFQLLVGRAKHDPQERVRRAAVEVLGRRFAGRPELTDLLIDRVRADSDAGVMEAAAGALIAGFGATAEVRRLLLARLDAEPAMSAPPRSAMEDGVRRGVLRLLTRCCDPATARELLRAALAKDGDRDAGARGVALAELLRLEPEGAGLRELLADRAVADSDGGIRLTALRALDERFGPERDRLARAATEDTDAGVREYALARLAEQFPDPDTARLLATRAEADEAARPRLAATRLLAEHFTGTVQSRDLIIRQAAGETDTVVRLAAVRALIRSVADPAVQTQLFLRVEKDGEPQIVREAAEALADWRDYAGRVCDRLAARAQEDDYAGVRLAAIETLVSRQPFSEIADLLWDRAEHDPDPAVFRTAAETLAAGPDATGALAALLRHRAGPPAEPAIRREACELLGRRFGADPAARALLVQRARDDEEVEVRRAAVAALDEGGARRPEARALLIDLVDDPDWSVRRTAVHALGRYHGADEDVRALFIQRARTAGDADTRHLLAQALTWLPQADPADLPDA
ncbi:HEAT repeat domain-containing protein [Dactylosporangium vinaceum]|uniref:HEAT repeat domain-containing protein n=1 Tax=Dactylosporangium vinaceum TaxID=53362 RepID=A0ABV5MIK1_9ACTN|nr:HEAT repeat domain-containing protein [Dactylosporangium vinaceum]UAB97624.1 HEAT repeat domain-containing protein [Dactylosporangium vinaceum]